LDSFERAKAGQGQVFSIVAEAGIGKSRLLYEFRKNVVNENITFLEGKCLSYSRGVAYHPIIDVLKSAFDIREYDEDFQVKEKVKKGLDILEVEQKSALPYVLELLSVKESGINQIPMSPEAKKDRFIETLKRIVFKDSVIRPLILAFEDLHWIDKSSEDSLKDLFSNISGARVLLIITYRPEFVHSWGSKSYHNQVTSNRLPNRESLEMVKNLFGSEDIDNNLEELILEKTEGVPFFIEEFIKTLNEKKMIEKESNRYKLTNNIQELVTPSTIQEVIMARIDSLPVGAREVLQTGSVIEREFSYELIKQVTEKSQEELLSELSVLKEAEILYERGIYPEVTYIFKHALIQEVVYDSILTRKKKKLHELIGISIEKLYKDSIKELYSVLAEHFMAADDFKKGAEYFRLAAKKAENSASFAEAVEYAEKRIVCLEKLFRIEEVSKMLVDARTTLGLYMFQRFYFVEAKDAIDPIIELAIKSNYKKRLSQINSIAGTYKCYVEENYSEASKHFQDALKISEETNDIVSSFFSRVWFGYNLYYNCEFEKAIHHAEKALDINKAANIVFGVYQR